MKLLIESDRMKITKENKLVIIINGKGESGKDTLINHLKNQSIISNISSIDPIKKIAYENGWNGKKDDKARLFLSNLKKAFTEFNDLPNQYINKETKRFLITNKKIMFVHIREPENISSYINFLNRNSIKYITLLVKRNRVDSKKFGNNADDLVDNFYYDYIFYNEWDLERSSKAFTKLVESIYTGKISNKNN